MKITKTLWLVLGLICLSAMLCSQNIQDSDYMQLGWQEFPIAGIDNLFIPYSNPSLLGTGNANGLGMVHLADEEQFQKRYWLMLNTDGLAYAYERDHGVQYHMLAAGSEILPAHILPNLYLGTNYRWRDGDFDSGVFRSAVTYRPHDFTSLAMTLENPMESRPYYRAGIALRPFVFTDRINDYRLELSLDLNYSKWGSEDDYELRSPIIGINTQLVDGLKLGATYNTDEETALISFSLSPGKIEAGSMVRSHEDDNFGYAWVHLTEDSFKPIFGITPQKWYQMPAKGKVVSYKAPKYSFGPFQIYDKGTVGIEEIFAKLDKAKADPSTDGILLINPALSMSQALQQELLDAVRDFKSSGKSISIYYDNISNGSYIFASAIADKIYLNPNGMVDLSGLAISSPYFKDLLDTIGIEVLNFRSHKYKSAGNMFSESEMTKAEREVYDSLLGSLYDQIIAQIQAGRGDRLSKPVEQLIDEGPYLISANALEAGLVDEIIYQDELDKKLKEDFGYNRRITELENYRCYDWSKPKENLVATIYASGNIVMGKGTPGQKIAQETTVKLIRDARKNDMYKGIILRVDSGGGSAQASDIIYRELELAKTENKKPIVVSMAGVAASGGYYIAANADRIVANPATLTGSIGVVGIMFNATEMFRKIKINWSTVKKGEHADLGSLSRPWTEQEKQLLEGMIEHTYEDFVQKVANGRKNLSVEDVHAIAQGRVWTGEQAYENGLVDDLGGLETAKEHMKSLIKGHRPLRLVDATSSHKTGIDINIESGSLLKLLALDYLEALDQEYREVYEMWRDFSGEQALFISPYNNQMIKF
ncbi:MAG: signal peptide peptidase SppA [Candidatus Cloacimonetes bacterium]|nr:signal peptide peptidase SppA [Candidatus Cloacimonadota bacterium]